MAKVFKVEPLFMTMDFQLLAAMLLTDGIKLGGNPHWFFHFTAHKCEGCESRFSTFRFFVIIALEFPEVYLT